MESEHGRGEVPLADGRCVPRSRYLLRSVAEERVVRAKTCTYYLLRGTLCEMRLEHILPRLLHPVFHINGRFSPHATSPSPSSYRLSLSRRSRVYLFVLPRLLYTSERKGGISRPLPYERSRAHLAVLTARRVARVCAMLPRNGCKCSISL